MTEDVGFACEDCGRVFATPRAARIHRTLGHGDGPNHGTLARYRDGCRCQECRWANNEKNRRDRAPYRGVTRPIDGSPETLGACLLAFGVRPEKLAEALRGRTVEDLHWPLWLASGELRKHCRCEVPEWIAEELRRTS